MKHEGDETQDALVKARNEFSRLDFFARMQIYQGGTAFTTYEDGGEQYCLELRRLADAWGRGDQSVEVALSSSRGLTHSEVAESQDVLAKGRQALSMMYSALKAADYMHDPLPGAYDALIAALNKLDDLLGYYSPRAGFEAEELRSGIEALASGLGKEGQEAVRKLLDEVDARDSLRWLEGLSSLNAQLAAWEALRADIRKCAEFYGGVVKDVTGEKATPSERVIDFLDGSGEGAEHPSHKAFNSLVLDLESVYRLSDHQLKNIYAVRRALGIDRLPQKVSPVLGVILDPATGGPFGMLPCRNCGGFAMAYRVLDGVCDSCR